jgi:hypothetical protein
MFGTAGDGLHYRLNGWGNRLGTRTSAWGRVRTKNDIFIGPRVTLEDRNFHAAPVLPSSAVLARKQQYWIDQGGMKTLVSTPWLAAHSRAPGLANSLMIKLFAG